MLHVLRLGVQVFAPISSIHLRSNFNSDKILSLRDSLAYFCAKCPFGIARFVFCSE